MEWNEKKMDLDFFLKTFKQKVHNMIVKFWLEKSSAILVYLTLKT